MNECNGMNESMNECNEMIEPMNAMEWMNQRMNAMDESTTMNQCINPQEWTNVTLTDKWTNPYSSQTNEQILIFDWQMNKLILSI